MVLSRRDATSVVPSTRTQVDTFTVTSTVHESLIVLSYTTAAVHRRQPIHQLAADSCAKVQQSIESLRSKHYTVAYPVVEDRSVATSSFVDCR